MTETKDKIVEFRFNCSFLLRERINERLKALGLERADVMIEFLEEWLKETDQFVETTEKGEVSVLRNQPIPASALNARI
jgi:hypothetical protein